MPVALFVSHPEVTVDPQRPVPDWGLSGRGIARMQDFSQSPMVAAVAAVWSSAEAKAMEAAAILAAARGLTPGVHGPLHENDRSATGFLPPPDFEATADEFFARPHESVRGWERAVDAQDRIAAAVDHVLGAWTGGDVAIVAHGGVGTLLLCRYRGVPVTRSLDQPFQGHVWAFDIASRRVLHGWQPIAPR